MAKKIAVRQALGGFRELEYTARLEFEGRVWWRTSFADDGRREDWVLDVPQVSVSVSSFEPDTDRFWLSPRGETVTRDEAMREAVRRGLQTARSRLAEAEAVVTDLRRAIATLEGVHGQ